MTSTNVNFQAQSLNPFSRTQIESQAERLFSFKSEKRGLAQDNENGEHSSEGDGVNSQNVTPSFSMRPPTTLRVKGLRKRYRKEQVTKNTLSYLLDSLQREQILEVIERVTEKNPELRSEFLAAVPRPTLESITFAFSNLEKRVYEAFPFFREGQLRDRYSFTRVKPKLLELQDSFNQYSEHFLTAESDMPSVIFSYLKIATELIHRLPEWDFPEGNEIKKRLYGKLAEYWIAAIDLAASKIEQGRLFGKALVEEWAFDLDNHNVRSNFLLSSPIQKFEEKLGWVLGLQQQ